MPLMKRPSKKAFIHNVEAEMHAGKPKAQSLAIAYDMKRRNKSKMAEGGRVNPEATASLPSPRPDKGYGAIIVKAEGGKVKGRPEAGSYEEFEQGMNEREKRPEIYARKSMKNLAKQGMLKHGRPANPEHPIKDLGKKLAEGGIISAVNEERTMQAQSNNGRKVMPIKRPKMVPSNSFSTRLYDKEGHLEESAKPNPSSEQPDRDMNEEGPDRQGPKVSDMQDEHSTSRKPYAKGGKIEASDEKHPISQYEDALTDLTPSEDEGEMMADSHDEIDQDMQGNGPDMEEPHNEEENKIYRYADGGEISPEDEIEEEHHDSIAAAIMAKKAKASQMSDSDIDEMMNLYAAGGEVDLSINADEEPNHEDQYSFNALKKENYSESDGLDMLGQPEDSNLHGDMREDDEENKLDRISRIRARIKHKQS